MRQWFTEREKQQDTGLLVVVWIAAVVAIAASVAVALIQGADALHALAAIAMLVVVVTMQVRIYSAIRSEAGYIHPNVEGLMKGIVELIATSRREQEEAWRTTEARMRAEIEGTITRLVARGEEQDATTQIHGVE